MVPEYVLKQAQQATPNPKAGDSEWEKFGDVVKGEWLHIGNNSWKAGYQWCIKSKALVESLSMEVKQPYAAADAWGRGRRGEFPQDFGAGTESLDSGRKLSTAGSSHNPLEPSQPQSTGLSSR
jgi:hypothetical protein